MKLEKYRYIAVEGPIGAGKTSLARRLAEHLGSHLLLEKPDENPFLEKFYDDMGARLCQRNCSSFFSVSTSCRA